jgi:hypothetical protein
MSLSLILEITKVLDPTSKMAYFKKNWPEHLQDEVLACLHLTAAKV